MKVLKRYVNTARTEVLDVEGPKLKKTKPSCFGDGDGSFAGYDEDNYVMCSLSNVKTIIYNNLIVKDYEEW